MRHTVSVLILLGLSCGGVIQSASAQCVVDNKRVFIDPRLVPRVQHMSADALRHLMTHPDYNFPEKQRLIDEYMKQFQHIKMPLTGGIVLISPNDPCIQQFIPR
jgi:hypothetical protein